MDKTEYLLDFLDSMDWETGEKGERLYKKKQQKIAVAATEEDRIVVQVPSEHTSEIYEVVFYFDTGDEYVTAECNCPAFTDFDECKHCVAAAQYLIDHEDKLSAQPLPAAEILPGENEGPGKIIQQFKNIGHYTISSFSRKNYSWNNYFNEQQCTLIKIENTEHFFSFTPSSKSVYLQQVKYIDPDKLEMSCTCGKAEKNNICLHLFTALTWLSHKYGDYYFNRFKDYTNEKNKLLEPYGLTMTDAEATGFTFAFNYHGELIIESAPPYFVKITDDKSLTQFALGLVPQQKNNTVARPALPAGKFIDFELGYLFNFAVKQHIHFSLQPLSITQKNNKTSIEKITLSKTENLAYLKALDDETYLSFQKLTDEALQKHLVREGCTGISHYSAWQQQLDERAVEILRAHYHGVLKELWPFLLQQQHVYILPADKNFSTKNIAPLQLGQSHPAVSFRVLKDDKFITVQLLFTVEEESFSVVAPPGISRLFIIHNDKYYLLETFAHVQLLKQFQAGMLKFPLARRHDVLRKLVMPLQQHYVVDVDAQLQFETRKAEAVPQLMVSEYMNQYLMLRPQFVYDGNITDYDDEPDLMIKNGDSFYVIERDKTTEKNFQEQLRYLHPSFIKQKENFFYYLPFADVMKDNWFLNAIRRLQEDNITVIGMQDLKKFRYSTAKPVWEMKAGSGIDWFDLQITVSFGEQQVPLRDIQKAIRSNQKIVVLGDGSFGVLPDEWLQQFGLLMKMGEENNGTLRINKMHFSLIDELHKLIDEETILKELEDKKQKLHKIETVQPKPVSKSIQAALRTYQQTGFSWMQVLDELGWGGCLADDMGLGKTLQAICFLQFVKEKYNAPTSLVVCPTSLIYNWEMELQKFAPSLKYHIYYGSNRSFSNEHFESYDIIITSYGTMRNDIKELQQHTFQYIILDESQQIKNPDAQVTKAAQLLRAGNRIILSGTPVQNNTFDLYAQMHFLNPGFLGNKDFFKTEFATPIDKNGNSETAAQLRRLIYPFMLRRTKEQVAKDLPDKTEAVVWCEMGKEQRAVYEDYKNYYRHQLLEKIEEEGIQKAAIYILEGLLRLRQICDSPVLVKDEEVATAESIKLEELLREVLENTGSHKLLVFSQFTEMLSLVKDAFVQHKIAHLYLDGSVPAAKRKQLVEAFQTDEKVKAFLISLKAGGVGLNLTAADYVYLIDPWWNPAAENQAIDRTHRIGQTKKIFAYKMICKDTVEEKILQLQQKKKALSKELISEESSFIKKLTKDDVAFLFS
ncbi:SNF2-related protein [Parafilimonas sp.]|uniref:DEAD/DEAH box helicase n=1 Tax=Parafilimonas sp. TaxID=1969739 RepID=UPI0039E55AFB